MPVCSLHPEDMLFWNGWSGYAETAHPLDMGVPPAPRPAACTERLRGDPGSCGIAAGSPPAKQGCFGVAAEPGGEQEWWIPTWVPSLEGPPSFPGYQPKGFLGWGGGTECECSSALQDISTRLHWVWNSVCFRRPQDAALIPGGGGRERRFEPQPGRQTGEGSASHPCFLCSLPSWVSIHMAAPENSEGGRELWMGEPPASPTPKWLLQTWLPPE